MWRMRVYSRGKQKNYGKSLLIVFIISLHVVVPLNMLPGSILAFRQSEDWTHASQGNTQVAHQVDQDKGSGGPLGFALSSENLPPSKKSLEVSGVSLSSQLDGGPIDRPGPIVHAQGTKNFVNNVNNDHAPADLGTYSSWTNMQSVGLVNTLTEEEKSISMAILAWGAAANTTPAARLFDGANWTQGDITTSIGDDVAWSKAVASPTNNSEVLVAVSDYTVDINTMIYNNATNTFEHILEVATDISQIDPGAGKPAQNFDIAYETSSGDKLIVYQDGTTTPKYRTMSASSSSWSAEFSLTVSSTGTPYWIQLASSPSPSSNEIVLVYGDSNNDIYAQVWSGTTWGSEKAISTNAFVADFGGPSAVGRVFSLAYEYSSGYCMVIWWESTGGQYLFWSGSAWDSSGTALVGEPAMLPDQGGWVEMATDSSNSSGDLIGVVFIDRDAQTLDADVWTGAAWDGAGTMKRITSDIDGGKNGPHVDLEFEGSTSSTLIVLHTDRTAFGGHYIKWVRGTGWDALNTQLPSSPAIVKCPVNIARDPSSDRMIAVIGDGKDLKDHYTWSWSGSAWTYEGPLGSPPSGQSKYLSHYVVYLGGGGTNNEFDREIGWEGANFDETSEYLCIKTGTVGNEDLNIDVWNSSSWITIATISNTNDNTWINTSISTNLSDATIEFRFHGTNESSDSSQDTWEIDAVLIHTWTADVHTEIANASVANASMIHLQYGDSFQWWLMWNDTDQDLPIADSTPLFAGNGTTHVEFLNVSQVTGNHTFQFVGTVIGLYQVTVILEDYTHFAATFTLLFEVQLIPTNLNSALANGTSLVMLYNDSKVIWITWWDANHSMGITMDSPQTIVTSSLSMTYSAAISNPTGGNFSFIVIANRIGLFSAIFVFTKSGYSSQTFILYFTILPRPTEVPTPELAFLDSSTVGENITGQYSWKDNGSQPVIGASVTVFLNDTVADDASYVGDSGGSYDIVIDTADVRWGYYNLTLSFRSVGYENQTVTIFMDIIGLPTGLSLTLPDALVRGEDFVVEAYLYQPTSSVLLQTGDDIPVENELIAFSLSIIFDNGTDFICIGSSRTNSEGTSTFYISHDKTKNIETLLGISVRFTGSSLHQGTDFSVAPEDLPSVVSRTPQGTSLPDQLVKFAEKNLMYIAIAMLLLLLLSVASSYKVRAYQRTKKLHQILLRSLQEIRSMRMVIIRHQDGIPLFSQNFSRSGDDLDHAVAGMSTAIAAFLADVATSMLEDGATYVTEFVRMEQRSLHMLQRNGPHTAVIVISEASVDRFTEENVRNLQLEIEERFAEEFERFMTNEQIPTDQLESMVSKHLYTGLLGPIQLNETKLESQKGNLSSREKHLLRKLRSLKTILHNLDSYVSHLQHRGVSLALSIEFLLKGYQSGLFEILSPEQLSEQQHRTAEDNEDSTGDASRTNTDIQAGQERR
ncbi:MAG: hypothetical protein ACE5OZ_12685 [Candidatus Heimdallarchaeota archaeon]